MKAYSTAESDAAGSPAVEAEAGTISVGIVSHNAYGAIHGGNSGFIGGVEWQTSMLARWLALRGHRVSLLTWEEGGPQDEIVEGVRILKTCRPSDGLPGLRFFYPKWTGLTAAMRRANADVYYHNCGENVTGQIALWCRRQGKAFVFSAANDYDCDARLPELRLARDRCLYRHGLRAADRIVVQTETQRGMMLRNFGVDAQVIPMPCHSPEPAAEVRDEPVSGRVLWASRVCAQKRPDRLMEIAESMPELQFDMVGPDSGDESARLAIARGRQLRNVSVHGRVSPGTIREFYHQAACLLCTSDYEGFPNTFLEAWSYGLPIVSTFDPDGLIVARRMGFVAPSVAGLSTAIRELLGSPAIYRRASANALSYYQENHAAERVMPRFEAVLTEAAQRAQLKR